MFLIPGYFREDDFEDSEILFLEDENAFADEDDFPEGECNDDDDDDDMPDISKEISESKSKKDLLDSLEILESIGHKFWPDDDDKNASSDSDSTDSDDDIVHEQNTNIRPLKGWAVDLREIKTTVVDLIMHGSGGKKNCLHLEF